MLNRAKVLEQLKNVEDTLFTDISAHMHEARRMWEQIANDTLFKARVNQHAEQLALPVWYNNLAEVITIKPRTADYFVGAVDGSQIFPDRHQGNSSFLINVGTVGLQYGKHAFAKLDSQPYVFTAHDTQNEPLVLGAATPDGISSRRHTLELRHGAALMQQYKREGMLQALLLDGSLLFWHLASKPLEIQHYFAAQYMTVLEELYNDSCLVAGYTSLPHGKDLVSLIRFFLADCDPILFKDLTLFDILLDKHIIQFYVPEGSRTGIFKSNAAIAALYPEHLRPFFFYMQGEKEIARIEVPAWIAYDEAKVGAVATIIADQTAKGGGYPISLAEAHEQAVVKGPDREFFYHIVQKVSIAQNRAVLPSQKSLKKRIMSV